MPESIDIKLKRIAVAVADASDYEEAAGHLGISMTELTQSIQTLENLLCIRIFDREQRLPQLTGEGRFLIQAFREALSAHDRNVNGDAK